jgi:hypothetical protein
MFWENGDDKSACGMRRAARGEESFWLLIDCQTDD